MTMQHSTLLTPSALHLNLLKNDTSDNGAQHLSKAINLINKICQLCTLDLSYSSINHKGAQYLA